MSASSSGPSATQSTKLRELTLPIFGTQRSLGSIPTSLHTDARTTVLGLVRDANEKGKPIALPPDRTAAVDAALRAGGNFDGIASLATAIATWRRELRADVTADGINEYYDKWRAEGYTERLGGAQEALTMRCAELAGLEPSSSEPPTYLLDLGCGSGLSVLPLQQRHGPCAVLGLDLSWEMLLQAKRSGCRDLVQADLSMPLPLRPGIVDHILSVSAVQFLCEPASGRTAEQRLGTCFGEMKRVLTPPPPPPQPSSSSSPPRLPSAAIQFHPSEELNHPAMIRDAAVTACGTAALVLDQPHRTSAKRWFLVCTPSSSSSSSFSVDLQPPCSGMYAPHKAASLLSLREWVQNEGAGRLPLPRIEPAHEAWLKAEHCRFAHKALRLLRRVEAEEERKAAEPAEEEAVVEASSSAAAPQEEPPQPAAGSKRRRKRKDKGYLAPRGDGGGPPPMSAEEREVAIRLREAFGLAAGECPTLEGVQAQSETVLAVLHAR